MRLIKMLGLTAVAAVAAMALIGASSAMATGPTALCTVHEDPCQAAHIYTGHIEGVAVTPPKLLSSITTVTCNESKILGNALGLGTPQITHLESLKFEGDCLTSAGQTCTVTTVAKGLLLLLRTALNLGTLESHNTEVNVKCGFIINCTYGGLPAVHAEGSVGTALALVKTNGVALTSTGGGICPATSNWDAEYKITLPDPIYITT